MAQPDLILKPFGAEATAGTINVIPDERPSGSAPQLASWSLGFPLITMTYPGAGGLPPFGQDMNGVLNAISQHTVFLGGGGQYKWSSAYVMAFGGYSLGSIVQANDGLNSYVSLINNNSDDFNSFPGVIGTSWALYSGMALQQSQATETVMGIARIATNPLAVAGSDDATIMTPLKVRLAVRSTSATEELQGTAKLSSSEQAIAGADDTTIMTPLKTKIAIVDDKTHIKGEACSYAGFLGGSVAGAPYFRHFPSDTVVGLATASALAALLPKRSFFVNDFIRIPDVPGGLIIQFGVTGSVAGSGGSIFQTFPTPFPTKVNVVLISLNTASGDSTSTPSWVRDKSVTGFTPVNQNVLPATFSWIAIGN